MLIAKNRSFRIQDPLWERAMAIAHWRGETLSGVLVAAIRRYVRRYDREFTAATGQDPFTP